MMTLDFSSGSVEPFWDAVVIYDGDSDTAPIIANLDGDLSGQSFTATNPDGLHHSGYNLRRFEFLF